MFTEFLNKIIRAYVLNVLRNRYCYPKCCIYVKVEKIWFTRENLNIND